MKIKERKCITNKIKKNTDTSNVDSAFKTFKEEMEKHKIKNPNPLGDYIEPCQKEWPKKSDVCLHTQCQECKTNRNHVHMISCPCRDCTPWTMTTTDDFVLRSKNLEWTPYYTPPKEGFWIGSNYVGPSETVLTYSGLHTQ